MDENIEEWVKKMKERSEKRQAKLFPIEETPVSENITCSEQGEVSYPALSPLPEETDSLSMAETDRQDESSITEYRRENTSPSQLDYSSDLSLECDDGDTTATNDFYRAEPVVCHSSPILNPPQISQSGTGSRQASPRKTPHAPPQQATAYHKPQSSSAATVARRLTMQQHRSDPHAVAPLQERQMVHKTASLQSSAVKSKLSSDEQLMKDLSRKIERADNSIKQLSKAVTYSKIGTKEHIEAARLLKIAQVELHDFRLHKHKLDNGLGKKADSLGSLRLYNIGFEARSALKDDLALDGVFHYFFCIASCGPEVKATETIDTDNIRAQKQKDFILFKEELLFTDLPPDFVVELQVFEYVKKPMKFVERTLEALSTPKKSRPTIETEFQRVGFIKLTKDDRKSDEPKTLKFENGSKYINKRYRFQMELHPEQMPTKAGMLHVRRLDSNLRPDWARFWVDLSEGRIRFWRSKQDAMDRMQPEHKIDLKDLCSETVQRLTPDDDLYRQNSFVLYERAQRRGSEDDTLFQRILEGGLLKIIKHQFAADNKEDRDSWCALLDKSMHSFREWNGRANVHSVDEFKELFTRSPEKGCH